MWTICIHWCSCSRFNNLVGGTTTNHLEKYEFVNGKDYPIYYGKITKLMKPPTRLFTVQQWFVRKLKPWESPIPLEVSNGTQTRSSNGWCSMGPWRTRKEPLGCCARDPPCYNFFMRATQAESSLFLFVCLFVRLFVCLFTFSWMLIILLITA